jgi:exoribonuclease R
MLSTKNYVQFSILDPKSGAILHQFEGANQASRALPEDLVQFNETTGNCLVVERSPKRALVGILQMTSTYMYGMTGHGVPLYLCEPLNPGYPPFRMACKQKDRTKNLLVSFQFESWDASSEMPRGSLLEVLGFAEDPVAEQKALAILSCPWKAPKPSTVAILGSSGSPRKLLTKGTFNIDPPGCKDIDDCLTLEQVSETEWTFWITIADVAELVKPGSKEFETAKLIGATSYQDGIPVRPMLHPSLSESTCSLLPGELRNGLSLRISYSIQTGLKGPPVFEQTQIINETSYTYESILKSTAVDLKILEAICCCLGRPSSDPHIWIENCMVFYNHWAAKELQIKDAGLLRTHDAPFLEKKELLESIDPSLAFLAYNSAKYCPAETDAGHWGLNLDTYCHATSPIRRFADLVNQHILKCSLQTTEDWSALAQHLNRRQKQIQAAERDFVFLKAISNDEPTVEATFLYLQNQKWVLWVPTWGITVRIKESSEYPLPTPGTSVKISYFCDRSRAKLKERMILKALWKL